jgi:hypothetical protein
MPACRECTGKSALCFLPEFTPKQRAPLFRKSETAGKRRQEGQQIYWGQVPGKVWRARSGMRWPGPGCSNARLRRGKLREGRLGLRIGEAEIEHLEAFPSSGSRVRFSVLQAVRPRGFVRLGREGRRAPFKCARRVASRRSFCKSGSMPSACATVADRLRPLSSVGRFQHGRQTPLSGYCRYRS